MIKKDGYVYCDYCKENLKDKKRAGSKTEGVFIAENQYYSYYRMNYISSNVDGYFIIALNQSDFLAKFIFMTTDVEPNSMNFWHEVKTTGSDDIWEFLSN